MYMRQIFKSFLKVFAKPCNCHHYIQLQHLLFKTTIVLTFSKKISPYYVICVCLICDFCSSYQEFVLNLLHTPPHSAVTCHRVTVPTANPVVDFHHRVTTHFRQTKKTQHTTNLLVCCVLIILFSYYFPFTNQII